jgi:CheY-like chemotaxis protein
MNFVKRVFLIDDDAIFNMVHVKVLEKALYADETLVFDDAQKALQIIENLISCAEQEMPELIFLDISMSGLDGWGFLERLSKISGFKQDKCKIVVLSSSINVEDIERSKMYPIVVDFISKPLTQGKLQELKLKLGPIIIHPSLA